MIEKFIKILFRLITNIATIIFWLVVLTIILNAK